MTRVKWRFLLAGIAGCLLWVSTAPAQTNQTQSEGLLKTPPRVFLQCEGMDAIALRTQTAFVDHVAEADLAQVLVKIMLRSTEAGKEYTLVFTGRQEFAGIDDRLTYRAEPSASDEDINQGLARTLKMGLMCYTARTDVAGRISIAFDEKVKPTSVVDPWKFWVFKASTDLYMNGEKSYSDRSLSGSFSASRVTPEIKLSLRLSASSQKNSYIYEGEEILSHQDSLNFTGMWVKSLTEHWSVGAYLETGSSTYDNIDFEFIPAPAVEYNLFPYSQSTRRQLRFLYRLGFGRYRYREETIYGKMKENLVNESLSVTLELKQKWGSTTVSLSGAHYFNDFRKNRLGTTGMLQIRVFKGFQVSFLGGASWIHNQLALPKGDVSLEEVLLRRRELETSFRYYFLTGISFTFGSVRSNVVNPRFGVSGGMGQMTIIVN